MAEHYLMHMHDMELKNSIMHFFFSFFNVLNLHNHTVDMVIVSCWFPRKFTGTEINLYLNYVGIINFSYCLKLLQNLLIKHSK